MDWNPYTPLSKLTRAPCTYLAVLTRPIANKVTNTIRNDAERKSHAACGRWAALFRNSVGEVAATRREAAFRLASGQSSGRTLTFRVP